MEVALLVLMFTSLLREGTPFFTELLISPNTLTWEDAKKYCTAKTGSLIVLDSQEKWNFFITNNEYKKIHLNTGAYWIDFKFDDAVQCDTAKYKTPWLYDGWARWFNRYAEPNYCPAERCVRLQDNWMRTSPCDASNKAICEIDADMSSTVATTTSPSVATDVKQDVSSTAATTTPTEATDVNNDASSTTHNTPDDDMSSTAATTTSPTVATDSKHDVSSTTSNQPEVDVSSTVPNTKPTTEPADVTSSDLSTSNWEEQTAVLSTLSTATTLIPSAVENDNCSQCCFKSIKTRNLDLQERDEIKHALKVQLAVNKTNLSSQKRKLISVYDSRPSSVAMGGLACGILAAVVGVIVVPDVITLGGFVYKLF